MRGHAEPRGGKRLCNEMEQLALLHSGDAQMAGFKGTGKHAQRSDRCASPAASLGTPDKEDVGEFEETHLVKRKTGTAALVVSEEDWASMGIILEPAHPCSP